MSYNKIFLVIIKPPPNRENQNRAHQAALQIMATALEVIDTSSESLQEIIQQNPQLVSPELITQLVTNLQESEIRPHNAADSARILSILVDIPSVNAQMVTALPLLNEVCETGTRIHAQLAQTAMNVIGGVHDNHLNRVTQQMRQTLEGLAMQKIAQAPQKTLFPERQYQLGSLRLISDNIMFNPSQSIALIQTIHQSLTNLHEVQLDLLEKTDACQLADELKVVDSALIAAESYAVASGDTLLLNKIVENRPLVAGLLNKIEQSLVKGTPK